MTKYIQIMDYKGKKTRTEIKDFEDVNCIVIGVLSGDEVMDVIYASGGIETFDSSDDRGVDFNDGVYALYIKDELDLTRNEKFVNRATSYTMLNDYDYGEGRNDETGNEVP